MLTLGWHASWLPPPPDFSLSRRTVRIDDACGAVLVPLARVDEYGYILPCGRVARLGVRVLSN